MKRLFFACLLALALSATSAGAADVTTGHSGWNWGTPQPQGNTLRAVEFAGARGYAAGDFGTLLHTDDRGRNWTGVFTGTTGTIDHISIADENTVVAGSGCVLRRSEDGGTTWRVLAPPCDSPIVSISFPSAQTGYLLLDDGAMLKTTDGGATFTAARPGHDDGRRKHHGHLLHRRQHRVRRHRHRGLQDERRRQQLVPAHHQQPAAAGHLLPGPVHRLRGRRREHGAEDQRRRRDLDAQAGARLDPVHRSDVDPLRHELDLHHRHRQR